MIFLTVPSLASSLIEALAKQTTFTYMYLVDSNLEKIRSLCQMHKVKKLFVFGSAVKNTFTQESDVDLVVDFEGVDLVDYADNYFNLKFALESLLNRRVDLLEANGIRNPFLKKQIDSEKQLIYG